MVSESLDFLNIFFRQTTIVKICVKHFLNVLGLHAKVLVVEGVGGLGCRGDFCQKMLEASVPLSIYKTFMDSLDICASLERAGC